MKKLILKNIAGLAIDELMVQSLSNALYSVQAIIDDEAHLVVATNNRYYKATAIAHIKKDFAHCNIKKITVVHNSAYDEMLGQPLKSQAGNTLCFEVQPEDLPPPVIH